jgi:hypothetical protein
VAALTLATALGLLLATGQSASANVTDARHRLVLVHISPRPLFPTSVPPSLSDIKATLHRGRHGDFTVSFSNWDSSRHEYTTLVDFSREPRASLRRDIRFARRLHDPIHRVRVGHRRVYSFGADIYFGYFWAERGGTYYVRAHSALADHVSRATLAKLVASARTLGQEYRGTTSQGKRVILYRSSAGLDYQIEWDAGCPGRAEYTSADPLLKLGGDGSFVDPPGSYRVSDGETFSETVYSAFDGRLSGDSASGVFGASVKGVADTPYSCSTGTLGWTASTSPERFLSMRDRNFSPLSTRGLWVYFAGGCLAGNRVLGPCRGAGDRAGPRACARWTCGCPVVLCAGGKSAPSSKSQRRLTSRQSRDPHRVGSAIATRRGPRVPRPDGAEPLTRSARTRLPVLTTTHR